MSLSVEDIKTVTVDSYGTLVDPSSVEEELAAAVDNPEPVSNLWRMQSLMYTMVGNHIGTYQPFYEMNRDALQYALDVHGVDLPPAERDEILSTYHELEVFDDVRGGIERLRDAGYEVYVVSNGDPEMLSSMIEHADLGTLVADTISAHEIEVFKPDPEIYRHTAARTGTAIGNIVHVAGPVFDVQGAMNAGMQGAWLDRGDSVWGQFDGSPDVTVGSFDDVADLLT